MTIPKSTRKNNIQPFNDIQDTMSRPERSWSRIIHAPVVAQIGYILDRFIFRPITSIIAISFTLLVYLGLYMHALNSGYELGGFEPIICFAIGWALGATIEYLHTLFVSLFK